MRRRKLALAALLAVLTTAATACAQTTRVAPVATQELGDRLPGKVVWRDLLSNDAARARGFYEGLFGWQFETLGGGYMVARHAGAPVAGIADMNDESFESQWLPLMSVADVDSAIGAARRAGAAVPLAPTELPRHGRVAIVTDPQGADMGLVTVVGGDPPDREPDVGGWLWTEMWADDVAAAERFYGALTPFDAGGAERFAAIADASYRILEAHGRPRLGIASNPSADVQPGWLAYIRVDDAAATAERARGLGGQVLLAPDPGIRNGTVAIVADPTGGVFAIQEWSPRSDNGGTP